MKNSSNSSELLGGVASGVLIALGCKLNVEVGGPLGALLFSLALMSIIRYQLPLFTGKVGYKVSYTYLAAILLLNLLGAFLGSFLFESSIPFENMLKRFSDVNKELLFIKGIGCGALMFLAVDLGKKTPYITMMCIAGFILAGFEHCIADAGYMGTRIVYFIPELLTIIVGNAVGAKLIHFVINKEEVQIGTTRPPAEAEKVPSKS